MTLIVLTDEERTRLYLYLRQEAKQGDDTAKQVESLGHPEIAKKFRSEALAYTIIANKMDATEVQTIKD